MTLNHKQVSRNMTLLMCLAVLAIVFTTLALFLRPEVAGFFYDDGVYLMAGQALADGKGYVMPYHRGRPNLVIYPPLYPAFLALIWKMMSVGGNTSSMPSLLSTIQVSKWMNGVFACCALAMLFYYVPVYFNRCTQVLQKDRSSDRDMSWLMLVFTALVVLATGLHSQFQFVMNEVMSEALFVLFLMAVLWSFDKNRHAASQKKRLWFVALIVLSLAAFYTRTLGMVLIVSVVAMFALQKRYREGIIYFVITLLGQWPWLYWVASQPKHTQRFDTAQFMPESATEATIDFGSLLLRVFNESYFTSLSTDLNQEYNLFELLQNGVFELFKSLGSVLVPISTFIPYADVVITLLVMVTLAIFVSCCVGQFINYCVYSRKKNKNKTDTTVPIWHYFSVSDVFCCVYLLALPIWSYHNQYPRFLIVVLPFLLLGISKAFFIAKFKKDGTGRISKRMFVLPIIIILSSVFHLSLLYPITRDNYVAHHRNGDVVWQDMLTGFQHIRETIPSEAVLYTNHFSVPLALYTAHPVYDEFLFLPELKTMTPEILERNESAFKVMLAQFQDHLIQKRQTHYVVTLPVLLNFKVVESMDTLSRYLIAYQPSYSLYYQSPKAMVSVFCTVPDGCHP